MNEIENEENVIEWIFYHACKFKNYEIIHEILTRCSPQRLSHTSLTLAAIHKIVTDHDTEHFELALVLIKEIINYTESQEPKDCWKHQPQVCSFFEFPEFVKLQCHCKSDEIEQIYTISSSSDSGPLTTDRGQLGIHTQPNFILQNRCQEVFKKCTKSGSWNITEGNESERRNESSTEEIFVASSSDETSSEDTFPYIRLKKTFGDLCVIKLHKDENLSKNVVDPETNQPTDIFR